MGTGGDDPALADKQKHEVEHNDILLLASDGLFDNLHDAEIVSMIKEFTQTSTQIEDLDLIAEKIAKEAEKQAHNRTGEVKGGKVDDITVVVSQVKLDYIEWNRKYGNK